MKRLTEYRVAKVWLWLMRVSAYVLGVVIAVTLVANAYHGDIGAQIVLFAVGGLCLFVVTFLASDIVDQYK